MPDARADAEVVLLTPGTRKIAARFLPAASGGTSGLEYTQAAPLSTWTIPHDLQRRPNVSIFSAAGEEIEADVSATATQVTISFPTPLAGSAVLS